MASGTFGSVFALLKAHSTQNLPRLYPLLAMVTAGLSHTSRSQIWSEMPNTTSLALAKVGPGGLHSVGMPGDIVTDNNPMLRDGATGDW